MSDNSLLQKQNSLQKEAFEIIDKLDIIKILSDYGNPILHGSVGLGLMITKDIDIAVEGSSLEVDEIVSLISRLLKRTLSRIDFIYGNNSKKVNPKLQTGIYLGIKYYDHLPIDEQVTGSPDVWRIDIWFTKGEGNESSTTFRELKNKLTEEKRITILQIKGQLHNHVLYKKSFKSYDIYKAVLDFSVKDIYEFQDYLCSQGKNVKLSNSTSNETV